MRGKIAFEEHAAIEETLEQTSRRSLTEKDQEESEFLQQKLNKVPIPIFIG